MGVVWDVWGECGVGMGVYAIIIMYPIIVNMSLMSQMWFSLNVNED